MFRDKYLGVIGCGNIGEAIIRGIIAKDIIPKSRIIVSDTIPSKLNYIKHHYGLKAADNTELAKICDIIVLAVKPQDLSKVMNWISGSLVSKKLLISVLAGVKTGKIRQLSRKKVQIARVMPNMGALVEESVSAVSFAKGVKEENKRIVMRIFLALGDAIQVGEDKMDAITAISGSGPAYFFYLVEVLTESAVSLGIARNIAERLSVKTAIGSAKLLSHLKHTPQVLRDKITSKGGTTEAAFRVFMSKNFSGIVKAAVIAAANRSKEISGGK